MTDIQVITNSPNITQTKTYWRWKDTNQFLDDGITPNPNFGLYVDVSLPKVILEYTKLKYNQVTPSVTDILWGLAPFQDVNRYQVIIAEGPSDYNYAQDAQYETKTEIVFDMYMKDAALEETLPELEMILAGIMSIWMNYDNHKINGLAFMQLSRKNLDPNDLRGQSRTSNYFKSITFIAHYQIQRNTVLNPSTFTYGVANVDADTAGAYAN